MGFLFCAPALKPGDDLLFHRLSDSTIGAVRFHGRVRDGIGWVTDAMVTKLQSRRAIRSKWYLDLNTRSSRNRALSSCAHRNRPLLALMVWISLDLDQSNTLRQAQDML